MQNIFKFANLALPTATFIALFGRVSPCSVVGGKQDDFFEADLSRFVRTYFVADSLESAAERINIVAGRCAGRPVVAGKWDVRPVPFLSQVVGRKGDAIINRVDGAMHIVSLGN